MTVDVCMEIVIARSPQEVAAFAANPDNATLWYSKIKSVDWQTPPPLRIGSRIAFVADFLGRRLSYTYEIIVLDLPHRLVMRTSEGPFPMETAYSWTPHASGATLMSLRNTGNPSGFSALMAPFLSSAMKAANRKDLLLLKTVLEAQE